MGNNVRRGFRLSHLKFSKNLSGSEPPPPWGVLAYMGYIGMCSPKGYGFSAVLVINGVSNLPDSGHK